MADVQGDLFISILLESLENIFQRRIIYLFINGGGNVRDVPGDLFKSILFPEECFINKNWNNDL